MHQAEHTISALCRQLRVSRSSYYAWRERLPSPRSDADHALLAPIQAIHTASRGVYGTPRIPATLRAQGVRTSRRRVARLMLQQGIQGICRRRRKGKPKRAGKVVLAPDQVRRSFRAERPNQLWVGWRLRRTSPPRREPSIWQRFKMSFPAVSWVGQCPPGRMPNGWCVPCRWRSELDVPRTSFIILIMVRNTLHRSFDKLVRPRT